MAGRRYYSEYIGHFVRFYLMYPNMTRFKTDMEKQMYEAVNEVWHELNELEQDIFKRLYLAKPFNAEVLSASQDYGIAETTIWKSVLRFEDEVARAGKLL